MGVPVPHKQAYPRVPGEEQMLPVPFSRVEVASASRLPPNESEVDPARGPTSSRRAIEYLAFPPARFEEHHRPQTPIASGVTLGFNTREARVSG